jgi:Rap1a immunity proteins
VDAQITARPKLRSSVVVLAVYLACSVPAFSQEIVSLISGKQLYDECSTAEGDPDRRHCLGYVAGMSDALHSAKLVCNSGDVTIGQIVALIMSFYRAHPDEQNHPASDLAYAALREAFPCK